MPHRTRSDTAGKAALLAHLEANPSMSIQLLERGDLVW